MTAGPLLFARYAYAPNALGYCGADEPRTLLEYGDAQASDRGLAELARSFEGAWPYLQLIAAANRIDDPLDPRVVDAYWVGNGLLDGVAPDHLARHVEDRFRGRIGRGWRDVLDAVAAGGVPHHSFHVFAVYPWLGLMRTGIVDEPLRVLDQCRTLVESQCRVAGRVPTRLDGAAFLAAVWPLLNPGCPEPPPPYRDDAALHAQAAQTDHVFRPDGWTTDGLSPRREGRLLEQ